MLEFWCDLIFLALILSTVWLVQVLDGMMEAEP